VKWWVNKPYRTSPFSVRIRNACLMTKGAECLKRKRTQQSSGLSRRRGDSRCRSNHPLDRAAPTVRPNAWNIIPVARRRTRGYLDSHPTAQRRWWISTAWQRTTLG
jgi:hypothetical protein